MHTNRCRTETDRDSFNNSPALETYDCSRKDISLTNRRYLKRETVSSIEESTYTSRQLKSPNYYSSSSKTIQKDFNNFLTKLKTFSDQHQKDLIEVHKDIEYAKNCPDI